MNRVAARSGQLAEEPNLSVVLVIFIADALVEASFGKNGFVLKAVFSGSFQAPPRAQLSGFARTRTRCRCQSLNC